MGKQDDYIKTTFRIPPELHQWLLAQESMNATAIEAIGKLKAEKESADYRRGFVAGFEAGKKQNKG